MSGTNSDFDTAAVRAAIRAAMTMGLPETASDQATFRWSVVATYATPDVGGRPYDLAATPTTTTTHDDVVVPVAVEFSARPAGSRVNMMGEFDSSRVMLTVLDVDYATVVGADLVLLGGNTYEIQFVAPPVGLFDLTVYTVYATARDES